MDFKEPTAPPAYQPLNDEGYSMSSKYPFYESNFFSMKWNFQFSESEKK